MKAMKSIGVHIVRKAARASDPGDKNRLFARQIVVATQSLQGGQDADVAAPGAPARNVALIIVQSQALIVGLG
jgi:hypothetical protein